MKNTFYTTSLNQTYFMEIGDALTEVTLTNAEINLLTGSTTYEIHLPDGTATKVTSSEENKISLYYSQDKYIKRTKVAEYTLTINDISDYINIPLNLVVEGSEIISFEFYVWVIENGFPKQQPLPIETIYLSKEKGYTTTVKMPEQYYAKLETLEKLHKTKVINADGSQSYIKGKLSTLFLSTEQKLVLKEWEVMAQKLKDANIMMVKSENTGKMLAVNSPYVNCIYGSYDIDDEINNGALELPINCLREFYTTSIPLMCCEDRENDSIIVVLKDKPTNNE